jgi:hypothetical protein
MTEENKNEQEISVEIKNAFNAGVAAGKEEEEIKLDMIEAGAKFKNVARMYNKLSIDAGLVIPKQKRDSIVEASVIGRDLSTVEAFNAVVDDLVSRLNGTSKKSAAALVRGYAKATGMEVYKKEVVSGTGRSFTRNFYAALIDNPNMTEEEVHDFIVANGTEKTLKREIGLQGIRKLVNDLAAKLSQ